MCLLMTLLVLGPRAAIFIYWVGWPARWEAAFDSFIVPFIGFVLLPWTTLMYLLVAPGGVVVAGLLVAAAAVVAPAR